MKNAIERLCCDTAEFVNKRKRRVKRMAGETAADEQSDDPDLPKKQMFSFNQSI